MTTPTDPPPGGSMPPYRPSPDHEIIQTSPGHVPDTARRLLGDTTAEKMNEPQQTAPAPEHRYTHMTAPSHQRLERDKLAAEARDLWDKPSEGERMVTINESKLWALQKLLAGFVRTDISLDEPIYQLGKEALMELFGELGRQNPRQEGK